METSNMSNIETAESVSPEDQPPPKKKMKKKVKTDRKQMEAKAEKILSMVGMPKPSKKKSQKIEKSDIEKSSAQRGTEDSEQIQIIENFLPKIRTQHKLENYIRNDLADIIIDEISLEGLDGITTEALWTRISSRILERIPFSAEFENTIWDIVIETENLKFYLLENPRPKLVIFNRFKCVDWDTGHITEPDDLPEDIYTFSPISEQDSENKYFGSCANFKSRLGITGEVRQLSLKEAQQKYGSKLVIVADQALRNKALGIERAKSLSKLTNIHYCILERIGRSRKLGEVTAGKQSLLQMSDSKNLFYLRKQLLANNLITKQQFCMRNPKSGSTSALLFHLRRFYNEYKSMKLVVMEQIVDIMKRKPDNRIEYMELKKIVGPDLWGRGVQKLIKSAEFKQYVQTDLLVPYRTMYPNALPKEWKIKSGAREKNLRVLELVNPPVKVSVSLKDEDVKEDSSDDEPVGNCALNVSAFNQAYSLICESGSEGMSLKEVQRELGLDFYVIRSMLTNMMKKNLIETRNVDYGRLHILKYYVQPLKELDVCPKVEAHETLPSTSSQQDEADDEALSFIADVLQVDKDKMMAKPEESNLREDNIIDDPFKGHFDFIKEYRTKNRLEKLNKRDKLRYRGMEVKDLNEDDKKLKAEEREKYESIFRNEHGYYSMELSLKHKRIEPLKLNISALNIEASNSNIAANETLMDTAKSIQTNYSYSNELENTNLDLRALEKFKTSPKPFNAKILLGLSENASSIMKKYIFVPININFTDLLDRCQNIIKDLNDKFNSGNLEFPDDLLSDDECYCDYETKDKMSLIVNLEESDQVEEDVKEEDDDVKTFKMYLIKQFDSNKNLCERQVGDLLYITGDDVKKDGKRKPEEIEENIPKRVKLISESKEEANTQLQHVSENVESILEKVTDSVKMDIYMGKNPVLLSHCLDEDNIETTIITTEKVEAQPPLDQKYVNKTLTQRSLVRANFIVETVSREKYVSDIPKLTNMIKSIESEKRLIGMIDRKSVDRLLHHLVIAGYIKIFKIILKYENIIRCKNIICSASQDASSTIQVFIDQMKIGFFIYAKRKTDVAKSNTPSTSTDSAHSSESPDSYEEIVTLISNQKRPKYKHSRIIARQYGYVPKFAKIKIMHEFLFYLVYSYDGQAVPFDEVPILLRQFHVKLNNNETKELGTIYKRELSWKMFIPPLSQYKNWPSGWALICDLILRLPLSLFVKIFNIAYVIPELIPLLNDPVRKHILLKNVPADIRNACLHNRKCIFSIHEILCHLCYIGLLQFGVQKLKEKEQQFVYLNRRAILYDTTSSELGYHEISKKEYPVLQFYFENQAILDHYWSKLWSISMNTKLGQRYSLLQKTITLLDIHAKPDMLKSVVPKGSEAAIEADVGYIPGDKLGACCFDSSTWVHVKRNWVWSNSIKKGRMPEVLPTAPIVGIRRKHLDQVKVKSIKYKDLERELSKKRLKKPLIQSGIKASSTKAVTRTGKRKPVVRKVLPRPPIKKMKILKYDELDKKILKKMGRSRAIWSEEEDINIIICHSAKKFLTLNTKKKIISPIIVRNIMHRLCPNKRRKTTVAYSRRCVKLLKSHEFQGDERYMYHLEIDKYLQRTFSKFRMRIADGENISEEHIHMAFIYLVAYIVSSYKNKFKTQQKILEAENFFEYLTPEDIPKYIKQEDGEETGILYQNPQTVDEIKVSVIKDIVHCSLGWKSDSSELPLMLYRVYQHYPDHLLKEAISWLRKMQIIAGKKIQTRHLSVRDGIHMAGNLIHNSFLYSFKQITKYPDYIYPEAYQMFVSIYKRNNIEREFLVEKFEQGHGLGLSEIACWHDVIFSFRIPDDLLVLDPKITDHSQLIQELAVRYKFLINQRKNPQENDEQEKCAKGVAENVEGIEKAIEVIFEAQKQKMLSYKSSGGAKLILNEIDEVQLTDADYPSTSKAAQQEKETKEGQVNIANKDSEGDMSTDVKEETAKALQELTAYLGNKQDESALRISDLAYLLTKGLFPELDDDEERLEKLNRHFLIMYPSSIFCVPQDIMGQLWAEEVLSKAQTKGDEIQEIIRAECIVRNSSHDEEISNSLIDIGGDDEDIKLAFSIVNYIKHKGVYGASGPEIKTEFSHATHNLDLHEVVTVLIKVGIIFRAGVRNIKFIHVTENETWTVGLDDDRPISELNLNSLGVRLKLMPWVRINGTLNLKVLHNWMNVILSHCLSHPFVMLSSLVKRFNFLKPVDIFSLLEYLQVLDCLRLCTYNEAKPVTIFSTIEILMKRQVNILDGFDTIYIETDKTAIIKMGAFQYKGQTDIDIPFE